MLKISKEHNSMYQKAFVIFKNNYLFGTGPKTFRVECKKEKYNNELTQSYESDLKVNKLEYLKNNSCSTHPHNITMQILSETGIIGFFFILFIYLYLFNNLFKFIFNKDKKNNIITFLFSISLFINLFPIGPSGNVFHNWLSVITFLPIPFYLYAINKKHNF